MPKTASTRKRVAEAHDHHARRPHHMYDGTRPATPRHENQNHLQYDIKARKRQTSRSYRQKRKLNTLVISTPSKAPYKLSLNTASNARGQPHEPQAGVYVTKYPLRDRLTSSLLYASRTRTMTEDMKQKLRTTQRRMMRMIIQTKRHKQSKSCAAAHAASVDVTADVEPHDPDSEQGDDTSEHNNQDLNEHAESSHDADSNRCLDEISEDSPEDELEPWVDYITRATHKADDLSAASGITSWILRQSKICWRQASMIATHHEDRWTKLLSNINQAKRVPQTMKTGHEVGRRPRRLLTTRQIHQRQQRSYERHDLAYHGGGQLVRLQPSGPNFVCTACPTGL